MTDNWRKLEAIRLFTESNRFLETLSAEYDDSFAQANAKLGPAPLIRWSDKELREDAAQLNRNAFRVIDGGKK